MNAILDCGHPPSPYSDITTGYGVDCDGRKLCYDCCLAGDRDALKTASTFVAYLSRDKQTNAPILTNWPGGLLARVTEYWETSAGGFARHTTITRFRATDVYGHHWYGTSPGFGMYARMRRTKIGGRA